MAHALAQDLGVTLEFVPFDRARLTDQLAEDHFDVVMSGLVGTLERADRLQRTAPYLDVTLALVVPDHRMRSFKTFDSIRQIPDLKIGFVDFSRGFLERLDEALPLIYAVGARDEGMRSLLEHWIWLRKKDGTAQRNYEHWILGRSKTPEQPRWSVLRDVLGWVD